MRRALFFLLFALLLFPREARAQAAAQQASGQVAVQTCTALLTAYGPVPFCTVTVTDAAEFERQVEQFFTNGAGVMAMPTTGPGAAYFHNAASVLAAPTTPWGIAASPVIAPASSETAMAASMPPPLASPAPPAPPPVASVLAPEETPRETAEAREMMARAQAFLAQAQETAARAQEAAARAQETAARAQEAAERAQEAMASRSIEEPPIEPPHPATAPSDTASQTSVDVLSPTREPVPQARAPAETPEPASSNRDLEPRWALVLAGGLIVASLLYVAWTLIRRHRHPPPLHGPGV